MCVCVCVWLWYFVMLYNIEDVAASADSYVARIQAVSCDG